MSSPQRLAVLALLLGLFLVMIVVQPRSSSSDHLRTQSVLSSAPATLLPIAEEVLQKPENKTSTITPSGTANTKKETRNSPSTRAVPETTPRVPSTVSESSAGKEDSGSSASETKTKDSNSSEESERKITTAAARPPQSKDTSSNKEQVTATSVPLSGGAGGEEEVALDAEEIAMLRKINPSHERDQTAAKAGILCPRFRFPSGKTADGKVVREAISKYTRYVSQYCDKSGLLQMHVPFRTYIGFLDKIAQIVNIRPGFKIFDWGSGCGTMLNYYHEKFNTSGVGIDVTEAAVRFAQEHSQERNLFCWMDGSDLRGFPSEHFDAIVSWATLYHVRRMLVQCDIVHNFARMLKPGGIAFIGHLRTEKTQEYWKKGRCRVANATIIRHRDYKTFHMPSFRRNQFFSLVLHKNTDGALMAPSSSPFTTTTGKAAEAGNDAAGRRTGNNATTTNPTDRD